MPGSFVNGSEPPAASRHHPARDFLDLERSGTDDHPDHQDPEISVSTRVENPVTAPTQYGSDRAAASPTEVPMSQPEPSQAELGHQELSRPEAGHAGRSIAERAGAREWLGLAVLALPTLLI